MVFLLERWNCSCVEPLLVVAMKVNAPVNGRSHANTTIISGLCWWPVFPPPAAVVHRCRLRFFDTSHLGVCAIFVETSFRFFLQAVDSEAPNDDKPSQSQGTCCLLLGRHVRFRCQIQIKSLFPSYLIS